MKKLPIIILCLFLLASCSSQKSVTNKTEEIIPPSVNDVATIDSIPEPTVEDKTEETIPEPEAPVAEENNNPETVSQTVSITVLGLNSIEVLSSQVAYREKMTVLDLLLETAREKNIPAVYSGSKSSAYVTGIGEYAEKQHGPSSGWVYTINGKSVMRPCGSCILNPGDKVEWKYITEF